MRTQQGGSHLRAKGGASGTAGPTPTSTVDSRAPEPGPACGRSHRPAALRGSTPGGLERRGPLRGPRATAA